MNGQWSVPWEREPVGRTIRALLLGIALLLVTPSVSLTANCQFVLGFKTLRDLIGHDIVGECLDNEHYNAIGDSNQHTTGGLLAWRKADNWTAFTDGYRTWVNGPNGLATTPQYRALRVGSRLCRHYWVGNNERTYPRSAAQRLHFLSQGAVELRTRLAIA